MKKNNYLFYFVHPAKFHQFRVTINTLKDKGHNVEIIILGRDILEELVKKEGWDYTKIFSKGRKRSWMHIYISTLVFAFLTVLKLLILTIGKKYDLFITDDLLCYIGKLKKTPTIFVTDDDVKAVVGSWLVMPVSNYVFSPDICDLDVYEHKKIGYKGYKSLAHLHPNHFKADISKIPDELKNTKYFFLRIVSATSTHDVGKSGISNKLLSEIVGKLKNYGKVVISAERNLPENFHQYYYDFNKNDIGHLQYFSQIYISDSTTMCVEAAVMGVPAIEIDDWYADFKQYHELNKKYELLFGYKPEDKNQIFEKLDELLKLDNLKEKFQARSERLLEDKIDVSAFFIWLIEEYPKSVKSYTKNIDIQDRFK